MKRLYYILALTGALLLTDTALHAQGASVRRQPNNQQQTTPQRQTQTTPQARQPEAQVQSQTQSQQQQTRTPQASRGRRDEDAATTTGLQDLTVRAQDMNERMTQQIGNARWMRVIYREVDLTNEVNAPLYYPTRPVNGNMNLFSIIFQLMSEGKLTAYEYHDGYEAFDENNIAQFKEVLDNSYIYYEEVAGRAGAPSTYIINESDVPSGDVMAYYVKEAWYFDQNNSAFDCKILAICPLLTEISDLGEQRKPLFWLPYENLRPYITNSLIMTSNFNNAKTFTIDDYFRRRMFEGEIIKTENLMNKTLQETYPQPDSLKMAQLMIEEQLDTFEKSLWFQPDTTQILDPKERKKAEKQAKASARSATSSSKETKVKAPKAEKSSPSRSVRRTR